MTDVAISSEVLLEAAVGVVGMGLLAAVVSLLAAAGYRWLTTRSPPAGGAVFVGLSTVAAYLSFTMVRSGTIVADASLDQQFSAGYLLATFLVAGLVGAAAGRLGDRIACQVAGLARIDASGEAAATVRSARLAVDVTLPESVSTAEGYRPVGPAVREELAGSTVRLPHGLSAADRRDRVERHLERNFDLDYAAVTVAEDGSIDRVVVGRRSSGLGSMLPPRTVGVAIEADPSPDASLGDPIELWSADRGRLVATATLRTTNGPVATVIVDADRAADLAADERYRLVTRPDQPTDGYEFASILRGADETVTTLTVEADGPLTGEFVGWLPGRALVLDREGDLLALPEDSETLQAGDRVWLLAAPEQLAAGTGEIAAHATART